MSKSTGSTIKKSILIKVAWIVLTFIVFYAIAYPLGFAPDYMKQTVSWFANNIYVFAFLLCFRDIVTIQKVIITITIATKMSA